MTSFLVSIEGIDKVKLLKALWDNAKPATNFAKVPEWDVALAAKAVQFEIYAFYGRRIKCDLSKDTVDPRLYDREFGQGKFESIVKSLRE